MLPIRRFDQCVGPTAAFTDAFDDPGDPVFKLIADRSPNDADLASQPTLSRFENQINIASLKGLRQVFVDQFIASFAQPPLSLTFDLDAVDDPTHGSQQLTLFHAFCEHYQYFRLYLHAAAMNLLVRLRQEIADPPPAPEGDVPVAALAGAAPKDFQNARRVQDPLGKGQPGTWRLLLIKVAATVIVSCRLIVVRLSGSWPNRRFFEHISQHVSRRPARAGFWTG